MNPGRPPPSRRFSDRQAPVDDPTEGPNAALKAWLKATMGYESPTLLNILTEEEIANEEELLEFWFALKDKLPVKAQKKLGDSLFHTTSRRRRWLGSRRFYFRVESAGL